MSTVTIKNSPLSNFLAPSPWNPVYKRNGISTSLVTRLQNFSRNSKSKSHGRVRCSESGENLVSQVKNEPRRAVDRSETLMEDPYGHVSTCMTSPVITTTPDTPVEQILPHFEHYTGIPVVDNDGHCVGIISNIDVAKFTRAKSVSLATALVSEIMTSPAFVIDQRAPVAYAAGLMLQHKVHRLPVVDKDNIVIGIITRTDIYEPLIPPVNPLLHHLAGEKKVRSWNNGY